MIDIDFKHGVPEDVWYTSISPDDVNDARNLLAVLDHIEQVKFVTASRVSRDLIREHFKNLPIPSTMPKHLVFVGDFAKQVVAQIISMALNEEPFLMGYFPLKK